MIFRDQLSHFDRDHIYTSLNQSACNLEHFIKERLPKERRRAAGPVLAATDWVERKTRLRSMESHRRMVLDTSQPMTTRRQHLFRGVMAGLKVEFSGWIDFAQRLPTLDLRPIFQEAGVEVGTKDSTGTNALSGWSETERPEIDLNPLVKGLLMNLTLLHELFHLTHPTGLGHELKNTPLEISANLFALEMLQPAPAAQNLLTADVQTNLRHVEWVIQHSRREAFNLTFLRSAVGRSLTGIILPAPADFRDRYPRVPSRDVLLASSFEENRYAEIPSGIGVFRTDPYERPNDALRLEFMTRDGLYVKTTADVSERQAILDAVVIDQHCDGPMSSLSHMPVQIPRMHLNNARIGGGQYLCLWETILGTVAHNPKRKVPLNYNLFAVKDYDGSLARRWSQNQAEGRPGGPLALPEDLVDDKRGMSFDDWVVDMEESFLKRPPPNAMDDMKTWQAECIAHQL